MNKLVKTTLHVLLPAALLASPALPAGARLAGQDGPPPGLAEAEVARSRACVPELARLAGVDEALAPLSRRAARIRALDAAVRLEDSTTVAPFADGDPLEQAVREWFAADGALGVRQAAGEDVREARTQGRQAVRQRLQEALQSNADRARAVVETAGDLQEAIRRCQGVTLVRGAVLEVCDTMSSPVCEAARAEDPRGAFQFVDSAAQLWNMEQIRAWTDPTPLFLTPGGGIGGSRTAGLVRRGNVRLTLALEPMIRERSELAAEQLEALDANLDSMGFTFDHPRFVMAPALSFQLDTPGNLGGESHWFLHFGDLSDPPHQVVWSGPAPASGFIQVTLPAAGGALARMAAGEPLSLTAVRFSDNDSATGEAIYTLEVSPLGQARAVSAVLEYMSSGSMSEDLATLVPGGGPLS